MLNSEQSINIQTQSSRSGMNLFSALLIIIAVSALCIVISKPLGPWDVIFANAGLYIDLLALLFLVFML